MNIRSVVESLLFITSEPLSVKMISEIIEVDKKDVRKAIKEILKKYNKENSGININQYGGKYSFCTNKENELYIKRLLGTKPSFVSRASLEVLSIVAYNQPMSISEISKIRGISSDNVVRTLYKKKLLKRVGRKVNYRRSKLYALSISFYKYFGIKNLNEFKKLIEEKYDITEYDVMINDEEKKAIQNEEVMEEVAAIDDANIVDNLEDTNSENSVKPSVNKKEIQIESSDQLNFNIDSSVEDEEDEPLFDATTNLED